MPGALCNEAPIVAGQLGVGHDRSARVPSDLSLLQHAVTVVLSDRRQGDATEELQ